MKLVVDIKELDYETIKEVDELGGSWKTDIASQTMKAVASGTPLQEVIEDIKAEIEHNRDREISGNGNIEDWLEGYRIGMSEAIAIIELSNSRKESE